MCQISLAQKFGSQNVFVPTVKQWKICSFEIHFVEVAEELGEWKGPTIAIVAN